MSRIERLIAKLHDFYGPLTPPPREPFTLFVWLVLSHNTTPSRRDAAFAALKKARALTPDGMSRVPGAKLEGAVLLAGPYVEQRLRALKIGTQVFKRSPNLSTAIRGPLLTARRSLEPLPRLGEPGTPRMLLFAADHLVLPVDAPTARVARRLGYGDQQSGGPRKMARSARDAVVCELPADLSAFRRTSFYLSHHGSTTCTEREPHCGICPLLSECPDGAVRKATEPGSGGSNPSPSANP